MVALMIHAVKHTKDHLPIQKQKLKLFHNSYKIINLYLEQLISIHSLKLLFILMVNSYDTTFTYSIRIEDVQDVKTQKVCEQVQDNKPLPYNQTQEQLFVFHL